ncbi:MAG TPA: hypothetical protein VKQ36_08460 [Ktedonobacterales bacterium]|nr:hypothetical protein [Ktedonobacterales bacterium]
MNQNPQYSRQYYEDLLVDALLDKGFSLDEALSLIALQERIDNERAAEQRKREQARWRNELTNHNWSN